MTTRTGKTPAEIMDALEERAGDHLDEQPAISAGGADGPGVYSSNRAVLGEFAKALREIEAVKKGETADTGKYKYKYASLDVVLDEVKRVCAQHNLAVTQTLTEFNDNLCVHTTLIHDSGETISFPSTEIRMPTEAQPLGSAATYLRRYSLLAIFAMAPEDDDGKAASQPRQAARPAAAPTEPEPDDYDPVFDARVKAIVAKATKIKTAEGGDGPYTRAIRTVANGQVGSWVRANPDEAEQFIDEQAGLMALAEMGAVEDA